MESKRAKAVRRVWTTKETKAFLAAYSARKGEFGNARKKKFAMQNVLEDLIAQNALLEPATVECLQSKLKNLLRAYKSAKDGNKMTGSAPISIPFEEEMDEIFGTQPNICNPNTINLRGKPIVGLSVEAGSSNSSPQFSAFDSSTQDNVSTPSPPFVTLPALPQSPAPPENRTLPSMSRELTREKENKQISKKKYYAEKINYLKRKEEARRKYTQEVEEKKDERFKEIMEYKIRCHEDKMKVLRQLLNQQEEAGTCDHVEE